jgi:hypothetical protein
MLLYTGELLNDNPVKVNCRVEGSRYVVWKGIFR